jgi:hypothetical protein
VPDCLVKHKSGKWRLLGQSFKERLAKGDEMSKEVWQVTDALLKSFDKKEIPEKFRCEGQTFVERCAAWAMHALEQLEDEIEAFKVDPEEESEE